MKNVYAEAIEVLRVVINDYNKSERILWEIAKQHPAAILKAAMAMGIYSDKDAKLKQMVSTASGKIEAIKTYREMTGMGLKEAKDAVEAIRTHWPESY